MIQTTHGLGAMFRENFFLIEKHAVMQQHQMPQYWQPRKNTINQTGK